MESIVGEGAWEADRFNEDIQRRVVCFYAEFHGRGGGGGGGRGREGGRGGREGLEGDGGGREEDVLEDGEVDDWGEGGREGGM